VKNLYSFDSSADCNSSKGSPRLVPAAGSSTFAPIFDPINNLSQNFIKNDSITAYVDGQIDVVNNFQWTSSPLTSREDVPAIELKEKRLKTNSLIAQLAYYSLIASGKGGEVSGRLANLFGNSSGAIGGFLNNVGQTIVGAGQSALGAVSNFGSGTFGKSAVEFFSGRNVNDFFSQTAASSLGSNVLEPYEGLYLTEDTKFSYRMPYFQNIQNAVTNSFNNDDQILSKKSFGLNKFISGAADIAESLAYSLAATINITEPGIYIEKPQFYSFGASGDQLNFSFPLINTGWATFEDVQRNWQLIFMLIYQNRPNRKSRDLIDPPCLYEVSIPGIKYMPFAYIQTLSVEFMGARRSYKINVPSLNGFARIQTIIPDAYIVTISLRGLVSESQNFLYSMLFDKQDIVSVLDTQSSTGVVDNFLDSYSRERLNQTGS
jgi:hypothetical protein